MVTSGKIKFHQITQILLWKQIYTAVNLVFKTTFYESRSGVTF